jgi:hypothetical protein
MEDSQMSEKANTVNNRDITDVKKDIAFKLERLPEEAEAAADENEPLGDGRYAFMFGYLKSRIRQIADELKTNPA